MPTFLCRLFRLHFLVWPTAAGSGNSRSQTTLHALRFCASFNQDLTADTDLLFYPARSQENYISSGFILRPFGASDAVHVTVTAGHACEVGQGVKGAECLSACLAAAPGKRKRCQGQCCAMLSLPVSLLSLDYFTGTQPWARRKSCQSSFAGPTLCPWFE